MTQVTFKYEQSEETLMQQLAGKLRGLKTLNRSRLVPRISDNTLTVEIVSVDPLFYGQERDNSRDKTFELLQDTFGKVVMYANVVDDDETLSMFKINPNTTITRVGADTKLIIEIPVEKV